MPRDKVPINLIEPICRQIWTIYEPGVAEPRIPPGETGFRDYSNWGNIGRNARAPVLFFYGYIEDVMIWRKPWIKTDC